MRRFLPAVAVTLLATRLSAAPLYEQIQGASSGPLDNSIALGRSLDARFQERINIKDAPYGAAVDGVTDDTAAWTAAINAVNTAMAAGHDLCIYLPAGTSVINGTTLPTFRGPGCVDGDGPSKSFVQMGTAYAGDLFSWSEAWMHGNYPQQSGSTLATVQTANAIVKDIAITGNTAAAAQQNALVFYDRDDFALISDVNISTINGGLFIPAWPNTSAARRICARA